MNFNKSPFFSFFHKISQHRTSPEAVLCLGSGVSAIILISRLWRWSIQIHRQAKAEKALELVGVLGVEPGLANWKSRAANKCNIDFIGCYSQLNPKWETERGLNKAPLGWIMVSWPFLIEQSTKKLEKASKCRVLCYENGEIRNGDNGDSNLHSRTPGVHCCDRSSALWQSLPVLGLQEPPHLSKPTRSQREANAKPVSPKFLASNHKIHWKTWRNSRITSCGRSWVLRYGTQLLTAPTANVLSIQNQIRPFDRTIDYDLHACCLPLKPNLIAVNGLPSCNGPKQCEAMPQRHQLHCAIFKNITRHIKE